MNARLLIVLLLLVAIPLLLMGWLGAELARREQLRAEQQVDEFLREQLRSAQRGITETTAAVERELLQAMVLEEMTPSHLRDLEANQRLVTATFAIAPNGTRLHPPLNGELAEAEVAFLQRTQELWAGDAAALLAGPSQETSPARSSGWFIWYWGDGQHYLFWRRTPDSSILGVEVNRSALLAEMLAALPETEAQGTSSAIQRITLIDPQGRPQYQWGRFDPAEAAEPRVMLDLNEPFAAWQLENHVPPAMSTPVGSYGTQFQFWSGIGVVGLALVGLAVYFYRESSRAMREAAQRVSFVNQVSHELRTPLTNIRLYGELLQSHLDGADEKSTRYLGVIASESQRLSRLISNILTFGRRQKAALQLHPTPIDVDAIIRATLEQFQPIFNARDVALSLRLNAPAPVLVDSDAVQQILGNLFSNVEKYAAAGQFLEVTSSQAGGVTQIDVADHGPGIPESQRERIFEPFVRLSDQVSDGTAGTGIGLSIARDLARLHGGELVVAPSPGQAPGACFRLTLATPLAIDDAAGASAGINEAPASLAAQTETNSCAS